MEVFAVDGLPEVRPGEDLAALIEANVDLQDGDVLCVASTIVSKAEDRGADLATFEPGEQARVIAERIGEIADESKDPRFAQAVIEESQEILLAAPFILAVTRFGHITVNAGIDRSNVPDSDLLLLPENPTESARRLHDALGVPVVVTDTSGRPFRQGQRGVALGWSGLPACRDWRGEHDRDGRELTATVEAVADELAATANLVTGEGSSGRPVAVVRDFDFGEHDGHDALFRDPESDLVRQALADYEYSND
ncbi:coenzyme F420-0:L-glutamate ligase [Halorhabdus salina]|uniref:coenzyme F420-0:L-glutamate ligase n=1 Tax=Halorhabdus salina TaxID=2750670 RepID=UPI0015EE8AC8|nr:coenzyme F420-0:L-glutamate ligase [Halorhabdus salina]